MTFTEMQYDYLSALMIPSQRTLVITTRFINLRQLRLKECYLVTGVEGKPYIIESIRITNNTANVSL